MNLNIAHFSVTSSYI